MSTFTSMVSKFAHETQGESSRSNSNDNGRTDKKRTIKNEDEEQEGVYQELTTQVRKSQRLSAASTSGPLISRVISADSVKSRPHHKRAVTEVEKKEETIVTRPRMNQSRNSEYAPPEVYAHLNFVPDIIDYDLDVLFVGINPGVRSSQRTRHFAGPTNHFWPCLSASGLVPPGVKLGPNDDQSLPALCNLGLTNLVDRPSRSGNELSEAECRAAAPILTAKIKKYRPRFVCFVSKQAWDMYTGVGLGLQTAWVSWHDEPEDTNLFGTGLEGDEIYHDRDYAIQNNLDTQGYRLGPYFERGPSADHLKEELKVEGILYPLEGEPSGSTSRGLKSGPEEDKKWFIKNEVEDEKKPIKMELDEAIGIKTEQDIKIKMEPKERNHIKSKDQQDLTVKREQPDETNGIKREQDQQDAGAHLDRIKDEGSNERVQAGPRVNGSSGSRYRGGVRGSRMFVMPSTSGRVTQYTKEDKLAYFKQLAELVRRDRQMRGVKAPWESI
ncbi:hypothetical protein BGX34_002354 [Mortierella sp. NVP85]|nr:hypothetical protein BGX34_002354 [Mortierella sp. NVP85]